MALLEGRFEGREAFAQAVRLALATAAREGWHELVFSDPDFTDWPLGERALVQDLQAWARPGRSLVMLAADYDALRRRHARFVQWRIDFSHLVACHAGRTRDPHTLPSVLWTPHWSLHRQDPVHSSGWAGSEPARGMQLRELLAEWLRAATPAFPPSVLGL